MKMPEVNHPVCPSALCSDQSLEEESRERHRLEDLVLDECGSLEKGKGQYRERNLRSNSIR
jgi:hypothetical protein